MDRCLSWFDCVSITSASSVIHSPHTSVLHRKNNVAQRAETKCCSAGAPVPTSIGFLKASTWCQMLQKTKHRALQKQGPAGSQKAWSKMKLFYVPSIIIIYVPWSNVGKSWIPSCHDIWVLDPRCPAGETLFSSTSADPFLPSKKVRNSWLAVKCQKLSSSRSSTRRTFLRRLWLDYSTWPHMTRGWKQLLICGQKSSLAKSRQWFRSARVCLLWSTASDQLLWSCSRTI